ncbi:MAG TPA: hypothetical protein VI112_13145, partial [Bacteroidia bacterium]
MDTSECFIELNNEIIIDIPFSGNDTVWVKQLDPKAKNLFENLYDIPTYLINKEGKSIVQIKESQKKRRNKPFYRLLKFLFEYEPAVKEYRPYKVTSTENSLKYVKDRVIIDFIRYANENEKGFLLLDS